MASTQVRWGLISTANINKAVIPPIKASARNELAAVASRSLERAQAYAREWGIPRAHGSYDELLADPDVDAIYIGLPNSLHMEWAIRCAEAGKAVLCEKPLALTAADVDRMTAAARQNGTYLAEAFMYRHHPQTAQVREMIEQEMIGQVRTIHGSFTYYNSNAFEDDVRWQPDLGGGSLWDVGCYPVNYARVMAGEEPLEVMGWQHLTEWNVDHTFTGMLRFPSGTLATFDCGFRATGRMSVEIAGDKGAIRLTNAYKPTFDNTIELQRDGKVESIASRPGDLYLGEVEDVAAALLDGKPPLISLEDSRANVGALAALYQSAREGRPVTL